MESIVLKVAGMSCGGCTSSVTRVLQELPGVMRVEVTLQPGEARIDFDPVRVGRAALVQAIDDAGFEAS